MKKLYRSLTKFLFIQIVKTKKKQKILGSKGSLTVQFLLGFTIVFVFLGLFFAISATLVVSSITQYITFSSARVLFLAHEDKGKQIKAAKDKYRDLLAKFPGLGSKKMFEVSDINNLGLGFNNSFDQGGGEPKLFYGVWTEFNPKILEINTMWGDSGKDSNWFKTNIGSYLGREPSKEDCKNFNKNRWGWIKNKMKNLSSFNITDNYIPYSDNGC